MKIIIYILFLAISAVIVFFNDFIDADFTQMTTVIDFLIQTIACSILFEFLLFFSNLGNYKNKNNKDY